MGATAGLSLTLDPMRKMFQNASSLKPLGQLKQNCPGIIIWRSSKKYGFFMPIRNPWWLPPQVIVLTQDYMGKYRNIFISDRNSKMTTTAGHSFYIEPIGSFYNQVNDTGSCLFTYFMFWLYVVVKKFTTVTFMTHIYFSVS